MEDRMSMRVFGEADGDIAALRGRTVAILGYGNQGRAQALNLRDSGVDAIVVGTAEDETWTQAGADGFPVSSVAQAARAGDVLLLLLPDDVLPDVFREDIAPGVRPGDSLVFASGYNLAFGGVSPPAGVDILLLAPRMIGRQMRELYRQGHGFYSFVSVEQDATGRAWPTLLALAKGIGTLRAGAFELSARDEAVLDLFHEQGFGSLVGVTIALMLEVGVQAGLPPEALVLDLYLSGEAAQTFQAMADVGFFEQSQLHSRTSQFGGLMRSLALDREPIRQHLLRIIEEVRSGVFALQWSAEREAGYENFERLLSLARTANPFTPIERRIRRALDDARRRGT
ncbi:MAG TPA: NAD(P)-binding domain-containing protein [Dehalococcoidia bacterium]|jgi:ketol-acid reductoisomerase|nr:NAD(P)-binding domain-containing protein [Dehalococcoidia bacterium]